MSQKPITESPRSQPTWLVFRGAFQFWAQRRQPSDVASVAGAPIIPSNSGGDALVVMNDPATARHAAHLTGFEASDGLLRRCLGSGTQGDITFPLVGPLDVVMGVGIFIQNPVQSTIAEEPTATHALSFDRAYPALGKGIQIGTSGRNLDGFHANTLQCACPGVAEIGSTIMAAALLRKFILEDGFTLEKAE